MTTEFAAHEPAVARFLVHADAGLRRVSCEVNGEQVSFFVRHGKLRAQCTCSAADSRSVAREVSELRGAAGRESQERLGTRESPAEVCEHQKIAASFLGLEGSAVPNAAPNFGEAPVRSSLRPPPPSMLMEITGLATALDELCLAMARTGIDAPDSPSIRQALDQVLERAPRPLSLTLARWVGRVTEALAVGEVGKVARLLDGAQRLAFDVQAEKPAPKSVAQFRSWLGRREGEALDALADSTLVEVGREWLAGTSRASIERRYLLDLHDGEVYSEERRRGEQDASVGPCPRAVQVAYAEIDDAVQPRRLRLLQYTVSPEATQEQWSRVSEFARTKVSDLASYYASIARRAPGTSEPFVLFEPAGRKLGLEPIHVRDASHAGIELVDDADVPMTDTLRAMAEGDEVVWIGGRLTGLARGLVLRPTSMLLKREGRFSLRRVT
ncbi:MAG: hypothetical protein QM778_08730 [Myxococcales bacterium]